MVQSINWVCICCKAFTHHRDRSNCLFQTIRDQSLVVDRSSARLNRRAHSHTERKQEKRGDGLSLSSFLVFSLSRSLSLVLKPLKRKEKSVHKGSRFSRNKISIRSSPSFLSSTHAFFLRVLFSLLLSNSSLFNSRSNSLYSQRERDARLYIPRICFYFLLLIYVENDRM